MSAAQFVSDYLTAIDIAAIIALIGLAIAAFARKESLWAWLLLVVVVLWAAWRILGLA